MLKPLTPDVVRLLAALYCIHDGQDRLVENRWDDLYEYFLSTGEMPYGVAKARTGDPDTWIDQKLRSMG